MDRLPKPKDAIARVTITKYADGSLSIDGNIGDKRLALKLLEHALDAVRAQVRPEDDKQIVLPNRDVVVPHHDNYPVNPLGDMPPGDWGRGAL